ncbi:CCR4-NOT transcription complex subunit 7-like [Haemaphysalis longicornis]
MHRTIFVLSAPWYNDVNNGARALTGPSTIREAWAWNLNEEFGAIMHPVQKYNYIAVVTEFPGVLVRPADPELQPSVYQHSLVPGNVNLMKLIQLSFSLQNKNGRPEPDYSTWEFNSKCSLEVGVYAKDMRKGDGIDLNEFVEWSMTPGIVLFDNVIFSSSAEHTISATQLRY